VRTVALGVPVEPDVRTTTAASWIPGVSTNDTTGSPLGPAESSTAGPSPWRAAAKAFSAGSMFTLSALGMVAALLGSSA
jgi:hypothetical protein